jgi:HEPN domain-containing protein
MTKKHIIKNWVLKSQKDTQTAKDLFRLKHYDWSLFIWHLAVEKVLKAKIVSLGKPVIYTHDLARLAKEAEISLNKKLVSQLNEITTFNIEARYDDYKLSFYKKATEQYAKNWAKICENIFNFVKRTL